MKRICIGLLLLIAFSGLRAALRNDSTYTLNNVIRLHIAYPDSALHILDIMEREKLQPPCLINTQRGQVYYTQKHPELALIYLNKAYADDSLQTYPKSHLQLLSIMANIYKVKQDYERCIRYLDEGIRKARQTGDRQVETMMLFDMGKCYYAIFQYEEAYRCFNQAIAYAENDQGHRLKPALSYFYGILTGILVEEGKLREGLELCRKRENVINEMEGYDHIPIGYLDQQRGYLYIKQATLLAILGDKSQSAQAYRRFKATRFAATPEGQDHEARYNLKRGLYDRVIDFYRPQCLKDTNTSDHADKLQILVEAYQGKQDYREAFLCQQRLMVVKDSLNAGILHSQLAEQNALIQMHEKEWTIKEQERKLRVATFIRSLLLGMLALVVLCLVIVVRNVLVVKRKNRKITARLNEQIAYEDKIEELRQRLAEEAMRRKPAGPAAAPPDVQADAGSPDGEEHQHAHAEGKADKEIFEQMERIIKEQKLYKNPELSRQDMLDLLPISKNRFAQMMQANTGMSFSQYVTNLRLSYSLSLLTKYDNYTLQAIADEAGFASLRNFRRAFKAKYGINPSEYRENRQKADTDPVPEAD